MFEDALYSTISLALLFNFGHSTDCSLAPITTKGQVSEPGDVCPSFILIFSCKGVNNGKILVFSEFDSSMIIVPLRIWADNTGFPDMYCVS